MTEQEQIEEMTKLINSKEIYPCEDDVHCENCFCSHKDTAEKLFNAGYRKVPFGATVLAPEERNDEIREMHEILEGRDELIAKVGILGRENYDLKAENKQLKTECALLDDELRIARQDTIDALNKVKERAVGLAAIETYHICNLIDELLKEYE